MNTGYPCKCGSERVHARLAKYGPSLVVELRCLRCGARYDEYICLDGADFINWERFKEKYYPEEVG